MTLDCCRISSITILRAVIVAGPIRVLLLPIRTFLVSLTTGLPAACAIVGPGAARHACNVASLRHWHRLPPPPPVVPAPKPTGEVSARASCRATPAMSTTPNSPAAPPHPTRMLRIFSSATRDTASSAIEIQRRRDHLIDAENRLRPLPGLF